MQSPTPDELSADVPSKCIYWAVNVNENLSQVLTNI